MLSKLALMVSAGRNAVTSTSSAEDVANRLRVLGAIEPLEGAAAGIRLRVRGGVEARFERRGQRVDRGRGPDVRRPAAASCRRAASRSSSRRRRPGPRLSPGRTSRDSARPSSCPRHGRSGSTCSMTARASGAERTAAGECAGEGRKGVEGDAARPLCVAATATTAVTAATPKRVTTGLCMRETGPPGGKDASESIRSAGGKRLHEAAGSALRFRRGQQSLYLLDCVVDLHVELALPQFDGRCAGRPPRCRC